MQMQIDTTYKDHPATAIDERTAQRVAELFSALGDASRVRTELGRGPGLCTRVYVWTRAKGATGRSAY